MALVLVPKNDTNQDGPFFINTDKIINIVPQTVGTIDCDDSSRLPRFYRFNLSLDDKEHPEFTIESSTLIRIAKAMRLPMVELQRLYIELFEDEISDRCYVGIDIFDNVPNELILCTAGDSCYYICDCDILSTMELSTINKLVKSGEENVLYKLPEVMSLIADGIPQATKLDDWVNVEDSETARLLLILLNEYYEGNFTGFDGNNIALKVLIERLGDWVNDEFLRKQELKEELKEQEDSNKQ